MRILDYLKQYDKVFSLKGEVLPCGREECKKLIQMSLAIANLFDYKGEKEFGNLDTGYMNIQNIHALRSIILTKV